MNNIWSENVKMCWSSVGAAVPQCRSAAVRQSVALVGPHAADADRSHFASLSFVVCRWSLVVCRLSLVVGGWSLVVCRWSLDVGRWRLVIDRWRLVVGGWWLVVGGWSCRRCFYFLLHLRCPLSVLHSTSARRIDTVNITIPTSNTNST